MTISELLKLITRYPASSRIVVGHNCDDTVELSGEVLHNDGDELILLLAPAPPAEASEEFADGDDLLQADKAIEQCENILELLDDLPERAEDFADSVREKVESIKGWIEENDHVTDGQINALDNMEGAVLRWIR